MHFTIANLYIKSLYLIYRDGVKSNLEAAVMKILFLKPIIQPLCGVMKTHRLQILLYQMVLQL